MTNQQKIETVQFALGRRLAELINRSSEDGYDTKYVTGIDGICFFKDLPAVEAFWGAQMANAIEAVGGGVRISVGVTPRGEGELDLLYINVVEASE